MVKIVMSKLIFNVVFKGLIYIWFFGRKSSLLISLNHEVSAIKGKR